MANHSCSKESLTSVLQRKADRQAANVPKGPLVARREFVSSGSGTVGFTLAAAISPGLSAGILSQPQSEIPVPELSLPIVDTNVYLSSWPFRLLPEAEPARLVEKLRAYRVVQAWAGNFDALLHRDLAAVNTRLVRSCRATGGFLLPFPAINPKLPNWQEDLRQVVEEFAAPGIRLHPDYHGYSLDDADFIELLGQAAEHRLIVQLALMAEDERTVHPAVKVPSVDPKPLVDIIPGIRGLRCVLLNAQRVTPLPLLAKIVASGTVYVDISWQEGVGGVANLLSYVPAERVIFGSYFPRFYFLSAVLKLLESAISGEALANIIHKNALSLLEQR